MAGSGRRERLVALAFAAVAVLGIGAVVVMRPGPSGTVTGTVTGTERPSGGITRERAIEIATAVSQANAELQPSAHAEFDTSRERWVWHVSWSWSAGPTAGEQCDVLVDLLTGEILDRACAFA